MLGDIRRGKGRDESANGDGRFDLPREAGSGIALQRGQCKAGIVKTSSPHSLYELVMQLSLDIV